MDERVGIVLDTLNNSVYKDNTIVVFTSDHGWQFGEKDYLYKNSPWEESTRIPMLWKVPNTTVAGAEVEQPISLLDIYPTLQELAKLKGTPKMNSNAGDLGGHSLVPLFDNNPNSFWQGPEGVLTVMGAGINKPIEGYAQRINPQALWHVKVTKDLPKEYIWQQTYTYRTKNWRYISYKNSQEELYQNSVDPFEWHNLANKPKHQQQKLELKTQMHKIIKGLD
jgi:iduronate 2-sulfatase